MVIVHDKQEKNLTKEKQDMLLIALLMEYSMRNIHEKHSIKSIFMWVVITYLFFIIIITILKMHPVVRGSCWANLLLYMVISVDRYTL